MATAPLRVKLNVRDRTDLTATPERALTVESPTPVRILTVCTGNICRSPVAERLLQAGLDQVLPGGFEVRSAGTRAMVGSPIQPLSAEIVNMYGGTDKGFAARQLTPKILRDTDIVLVRDDPGNPDVPSTTRIIPLRTDTPDKQAQ